MADRKPIRRALVSVYEKSRLLELGKALQEAGVEILSTGSTAKTLAAAGIAVTEVSEYTGFPEIMGGRVKTLHPRIHSGILADQNNPEHLAAIADLDIALSVLFVEQSGERVCDAEHCYTPRYSSSMTWNQRTLDS